MWLKMHKLTVMIDRRFLLACTYHLSVNLISNLVPSLSGSISPPHRHRISNTKFVRLSHVMLSNSSTASMFLYQPSLHSFISHTSPQYHHPLFPMFQLSSSTLPYPTHART